MNDRDEVVGPIDRKFGRASDRLRPLNVVHVAGFVAVATMGVVLAGCVAVMAVFRALPLDI